MKKKILVAAVVAVAALSLTACESVTPDNRNKQLNDSQSKFDARTPPKVTGDAEYNNYMKAQEEVYDDPSAIIWCTVFPTADAAPIFTVPIAGKLTSSSVSYFPGHDVERHTGDGGGNVLVETQSVDGMYHGSPAPYRYGFTPGGQYVDFTNLPTFCTTSLTQFQRQTLEIAQVDSADDVTKQAEAKLKAGDAAGAQKLIDGLSK